jgi:hypothetical protein
MMRFYSSNTREVELSKPRNLAKSSSFTGNRSGDLRRRFATLATKSSITLSAHLFLHYLHGLIQDAFREHA